MSESPDIEFVLRVLRAGNAADMHGGEIFWSTSAAYAPVAFFVNCSDTFWWGTSDVERITPENITVLEQAATDCIAAHPTLGICSAGSLFCSRVRQMRPQGCCYPDERELWPLFDACGPEREVGFGNPYPPGGKPASLCSKASLANSASSRSENQAMTSESPPPIL